MNNIYGYTVEKLERYFENIGQKKFKAIQIYDWLYKKRVTSFKEMSNIKKEIIEKLENNYSVETLKIIKKQKDKDVSKYLFELNDGNKVEAVLMYHDYGNSLCVSTEVGCNMGCSFCESGRLKKIRNLETYEMVLQILETEKEINKRISHVVLMGIGEPFDNYNNVIDFINIINSGKGIDIGARHITVSTCGIVPKIKEFIKDGKQVNLAVSLHASKDEIRNELMPINKVYNLETLMNILKEYISKTNRRVTFEYIMLDNINDREIDALNLIKLVREMNCYINLIPYNETSNIKYKKSKQGQIMKFYDILKKNKINVTIRKEFGSKVDAACGQLRANYEEEK
jgi:23S rRNA m2A2503 methyltransferase